MDASTPKPSRAAVGQAQSSDVQCCCKISKCKDVRDVLRDLDGLEHLAELVVVARSSNLSVPEPSLTIRYQTCMMALGIGDIAEGNCIRVARWHWQDFCFQDDVNGKERPRNTCRENPDSDRADKYHIKVFKRNQDMYIHRTEKDDHYVSAPAMRLSEIEERIVQFKCTVYNAGRLSETSGKEKVRREAWLKTPPIVISNFEGQMRAEQENYEAELAKANDEIKRLNIEIGELKSKLKTSEMPNSGALHLANLGSYNYWKSKSARILQMFFQIDKVDVLWGYVMTALIMFDSPEAIMLSHNNVGKARQSLAFPAQFRQKAKELALELTPSGNRVKIQRMEHDRISDVQAILLTLMSRRLRLTTHALSELIGGDKRVSPSTISRVLQQWLPRLGLLGRCLAYNPLSEEESLFLMPRKFKVAGYGRTYAIVDCRDVLTDKVRLNSSISRLQFSDKVSSAAARCFVMCHPCGLLLFLGEPAFARSTELSIFRALEPMFPSIPSTMRVMGDRAYKFGSSFLRNHNHFDVPDDRPSGGRQFTSNSSAASKNMSQLRYVVETINSRSSSWRAADDVVPREELPNFSNTYYISYSMSIFMEPLMQPSCRNFESLCDALIAAYVHSGKRDLYIMKV